MRWSLPALFLSALLLAVPPAALAGDEPPPTPAQLQATEAAALAAGNAESETKRLLQLWARAFVGGLKPGDVEDLIRLVDGRYYDARKAGLQDLRVVVREPRMAEQMDKLPIKFRLLWKAPTRVKGKVEGPPGLPPEAANALQSGLPGMSRLGELLFQKTLEEQSSGCDLSVAPDFDVPAAFSPLPFMHAQRFYLLLRMTARGASAEEREKDFWIELTPTGDLRVVKLYLLVATADGPAHGWARVTNTAVPVGGGTKSLMTRLDGYDSPWVDAPWSFPKSTTIRTVKQVGGFWLLSRFQEFSDQDTDIGFVEHAANQGITEDEMKEGSGPAGPSVPAAPAATNPVAGGAAVDASGASPETRKLFDAGMAALAAGDFGRAARLFDQVAASNQAGDLAKRAKDQVAGIERAGKDRLNEAVSGGASPGASGGTGGGATSTAPGKSGAPAAGSGGVGNAAGAVGGGGAFVGGVSIGSVKEVARRFAGTSAGDEAGRILKGLDATPGAGESTAAAGKSGPTPDAANEKTADDALAAARDAEARREFTRALRGYKDAAARFPGTPAGQAAAEAARKLEAVPEAMQLIEQDCKALLDGAEALVKIGQVEQAAELLERVINESPLADCVTHARRRKADLQMPK
ncbi:MAG: hypothetical protein HYZ53_06580 [Planctomycetes bacterium]|nr:hypothetical protein [Planctomycetota bacterium]